MAVHRLRPRIVSTIALSVSLWLCSSAVDAATVHWWRFESSPGLLADSIGTSPLTASGNAQSVLLPASGRGSQFPAGFSGFGGGVNDRAEEFDGSGDVLAANITPIGSEFTVECFAHVDSVVGGIADLVNLAPTAPFAPFTFVLQIRNDGAGGTQPREVILGAGSSDGVNFAFLTSGIALATGKDYYVGVSFALTPKQAVFYIQNLTDGGPLQVVTKTHTLSALAQVTPLSIGGVPDNPNVYFDGLIDEVRLSTHVLTPSELLINQVAQISTLPGPALLLLALVLGAAGTWLARERIALR